MRKCLVLLEFGKPLGWMDKFIERARTAGEGWRFKLFTPNTYRFTDNFDVVQMDVDRFNYLINRKLGLSSSLCILNSGIPSFHVTDFHVMLGKILEDYLTEYNYWGTIGNDCVVGRLDHFLSDEELSQYDVWNDDIGQFNAHFALYKNVPEVNELFKRIPNWEEAVTQSPCPGCTGTGRHNLYLTDEIGMTRIMQSPGKIKFGTPKYYLIHGHDRLEIHKPKPKLTVKNDGSLWELIADTINPPRRNPFFGREIAYFHFSTIKEWPAYELS